MSLCLNASFSVVQSRAAPQFRAENVKVANIPPAVRLSSTPFKVVAEAPVTWILWSSAQTEGQRRVDSAAGTTL